MLKKYLELPKINPAARMLENIVSALCAHNGHVLQGFTSVQSITLTKDAYTLRLSAGTYVRDTTGVYLSGAVSSQFHYRSYHLNNIDSVLTACTQVGIIVKKFLVTHNRKAKNFAMFTKVTGLDRTYDPTSTALLRASGLIHFHDMPMEKGLKVIKFLHRLEKKNAVK